MALLKKKGVDEADLELILIDTDPEKEEEMKERSRRTSVPQIFIGHKHVGGYDDLSKLDREGRLDELLSE
ncbi:glutaredoxin domain-containing protein [Streptomyces sp. adm13(2018)]|uniref:glutaredoxin domain-containing protein n=1 Tax=Streptomyces sp. adm13(2018) TaxID=2479007 RepID=UPI002905BCB3|nr:glutaredoxin domain-containing protein [Streptomyces sp. adm13(2018)]